MTVACVRALNAARWHDASAVWFLNNLPEDGKDLRRLGGEVKWAENVRAELEADGWAKS